MRTRRNSNSDQPPSSSGELCRGYVDKLMKRVNSRKKPRKKIQCDVQEDELEKIHKNDEHVSGMDNNNRQNAYAGTTQEICLESGDDMQDSDWEDGSVSTSDRKAYHFDGNISEVTIELKETPDSVTRKPIRRASAEDKEVAELVHKVHLMCLLARGRIIDNACDDPLIQASLLSLLPTHLLKISGLEKITARDLSPLIHWFHHNFHATRTVNPKRSFHSALAFALETREGTPEEVVALSVALLRALKCTTRFVSILDVAPLKPIGGTPENSSRDLSKLRRGIFNTSTVMVDKPTSSLARSLCFEKDNMHRSKDSSRCNDTVPKDPSSPKLNERQVSSPAPKLQSAYSPAERSWGAKRRGDLEFEMQLEMALSATAAGTTASGSISSDVKHFDSGSSNLFSLAKKALESIKSEESPSSSTGISVAVGAGKIGSPLHWAEVFCTGENLTGKWVHIDAVNAVIDGEQRVEAAAAACKTSLIYVVAFAGSGAKDVTRRYCMKWYKIAPHRINSTWWDAVLAPLKELESGATGGTIQENKRGGEIEYLRMNSTASTRSSLEDMELETRALTEPLPTSMQPYRNHQLYAIEKWLTKHQMLHPKGPILGFINSHPVYPRSCVQTLQTKQRWLREGLQVKSGELPPKVFPKPKISQVSEDGDNDVGDSKGLVEFYGKWQLEPLHLPHAVNGMVPKNERGQVDAWSDKCLPHGTVHIRLHRVFSVAKRLGIDYAPAMVGFEFRNGRSYPVYDGIVVCTEFKRAILEAYAEDEERRNAEEKKRNEAQAISRWYQLLSSIVTRQRLTNCYANDSSAQIRNSTENATDRPNAVPVGAAHDKQSISYQNEGNKKRKRGISSFVLADEHEHVFATENQSFDETNSVCIKRCNCGFSIQVEEI